MTLLPVLACRACAKPAIPYTAGIIVGGAGLACLRLGPTAVGVCHMCHAAYPSQTSAARAAAPHEHYFYYHRIMTHHAFTRVDVGGRLHPAPPPRSCLGLRQRARPTVQVCGWEEGRLKPERSGGSRRLNHVVEAHRPALLRLHLPVREDGLRAAKRVVTSFGQNAHDLPRTRRSTPPPSEPALAQWLHHKQHVAGDRQGARRDARNDMTRARAPNDSDDNKSYRAKCNAATMTGRHVTQAMWRRQEKRRGDGAAVEARG